MYKSLRSLGILCALAITVAITGCSPITKVNDAEVGIRETFSGEIQDKVLEQGFQNHVAKFDT